MTAQLSFGNELDSWRKCTLTRGIFTSSEFRSISHEQRHACERIDRLRILTRAGLAQHRFLALDSRVRMQS